jgi:hypothetical protein
VGKHRGGFPVFYQAISLGDYSCRARSPVALSLLSADDQIVKLVGMHHGRRRDMDRKRSPVKLGQDCGDLIEAAAKPTGNRLAKSGRYPLRALRLPSGLDHMLFHTELLFPESPG